MVAGDFTNFCLQHLVPENEWRNSVEAAPEIQERHHFAHVLTVSRRRFWPVAVLIAVLGVLSFVGTRDHMTYTAAVWRAVDYLEKKQVPARDFDAGYVINSWLQYAHPEQARMDEKGNLLVPHLTSRDLTRYQISTRPLPDASILTSIPFERWLGRSGAVYVIEWPDVTIRD